MLTNDMSIIDSFDPGKKLAARTVICFQTTGYTLGLDAKVST
jgi:hypothetical protein